MSSSSVFNGGTGPSFEFKILIMLAGMMTGLSIVVGVLAFETTTLARADASAASPSPTVAEDHAPRSAAVPTADAKIGAGCVAPTDARYQDRNTQDFAGVDHHSVPPWKRADGSKALQVFYVNDNLPPQAWRVVEDSMAVWSKSPCIDARGAAACPPAANCVMVRILEVADYRVRYSDSSAAAFGNYSWTDPEGRSYLQSGEIDINATDARDGTEVLYAIVVHEMGHSLGLDHRSKDSTSVMSSMNNIAGKPDDVDFRNLLALYGRTPN